MKRREAIMQDNFILYEPTGVQDILSGLSRQVKAVAFGVSYATDDGMSYTQNALWGMSDILHKVAAAMDDLAELPLPSLDELGSDQDIANVAQVRMRNRKAEDLVYRIKQLGQFQRVELAEELQHAFRSMSGLERQMLELDSDHLDDACRDVLRKLRQSCSDTVTRLEASLGELRRLNEVVANILPVVDLVQQED
jgi:hypothetical protein